MDRRFAETLRIFRLPGPRMPCVRECSGDTDPHFIDGNTPSGKNDRYRVVTGMRPEGVDASRLNFSRKLRNPYPRLRSNQGGEARSDLGIILPRLLLTQALGEEREFGILNAKLS